MILMGLVSWTQSTEYFRNENWNKIRYKHEATAYERYPWTALNLILLQKSY